MRISVHIEAKDENDLRQQLAAFFKPSYEQEEMFSEEEMGALPSNGNGIAPRKKVETEYKKKPGRKPGRKPVKTVEETPEEPTVKSIVPDLSLPEEKTPEPAPSQVKVPKLAEAVKLVTATQDECREALKKVISEKGRETAMDCLADFNVAKFSELNTEDYPKFIETCNAAVL